MESEEITSDLIEKILKAPFWPQKLEMQRVYSVQTDDTDGRDDIGWLQLQFGPDGDAWINIDGSTLDGKHGCRFRTFVGGGHIWRSEMR